MARLPKATYHRRMGDGPFPRRMTGTFAPDPFSDPKDGAELSVEPVFLVGSPGGCVPQSVGNATFFEGAALALSVRQAGSQAMVGTAIMLTPGLAVTATHVVRDLVTPFQHRTAGLACVGLTSQGLELWRVVGLSIADDDIAFVSLKLASAITSKWCLRCIRLTTRVPRVGEKLTIVGFRFPTMTRPGGKAFSAKGDLYAAAGEFVGLHFPARDRILMPYPVLEIECGSLGGMSGGAVVDDHGHLLGVVSRGWDTDDGKGPTYAEWIVSGLNRLVDIPWPPKFHHSPVRVMDINPGAIRIEGRDHIWMGSDESLQYRPWSDR
jgi:hypothetical protein